MKQTFSVKNWDEFQHYKDRNPPWIKLHNHLLDDYEFEMLGDAAKGHLLCIWMLASRTKNEMILDDKWITKKIGASNKVNLEALISAGFLIVEHDASNSLHNKTQLATVSVPSEEKRRGEERQRRVDNSRFSPPLDVDTVFYFESKGSTSIEAEKFWLFYDSKNWMVGKSKMKKWQSAASGWIKRNQAEVNKKDILAASSASNWHEEDLGL
ncbi:MAG: hypothetical protein COA43_14610 [Robiginitomaculum sp.]|nr:MAG: hypothetical protein COA43_14610 [Robiginitomaculum sp.]